VSGNANSTGHDKCGQQLAVHSVALTVSTATDVLTTADLQYL